MNSGTPNFANNAPIGSPAWMKEVDRYMKIIISKPEMKKYIQAQVKEELKNPIEMEKPSEPGQAPKPSWYPPPNFQILLQQPVPAPLPAYQGFGSFFANNITLQIFDKTAWDPQSSPFKPMINRTFTRFPANFGVEIGPIGVCADSSGGRPKNEKCGACVGAAGQQSGAKVCPPTTVSLFSKFAGMLNNLMKK